MSDDTTPKKPRTSRLKTLDDVRRFLAKLINEAKAGEIDAQLASKIGYLCNILTSCIKDSELEARIAKVEALMEQRDA